MCKISAMKRRSRKMFLMKKQSDLKKKKLDSKMEKSPTSLLRERGKSGRGSISKTAFKKGISPDPRGFFL